jgi:hypothetical protein
MWVKVLTLKQPWADLIKNKIKLIETRSWKTNYRGPIYIHASKSKIKLSEIKNKEILNYIDINKCAYGAIIAKSKLLDCIYMTEEFINNVKQNNPKEYASGLYEVGRYAWILDDIEVLDEPIFVKGSLGIWNYNDVDNKK